MVEGCWVLDDGGGFFSVALRCERSTHRLFDLLGSDMMLLVISQLFDSPSVGLVNGLLHTLGDSVGIHDYFSVDISSGASCGLGQTTMASQESLFVGIENGNERHFRQIETFAQ